MKKLCKVLAVVTLVFVLTGCMKIRTNVVIKDEDTASMTMDILYSKEMMDSYKMDADDLKDQFATGDYEDSEIKEIKETVEGKEYQGISVTAPKKEVKKILDELSTKDVNGKKEYTLALTKGALSENMDPSALGGAGYSLKEMKEAGLEMTMTIQMPGKITDATIGEVKGDTVTIDLLDIIDNADTIATITSSEGGSGNAVYLYAAIGVGIVAVIAVAYVVISKKKKAAANSDVVTIDGPVEVTSETTQDTVEPVVEETVTAEDTVEPTIEETVTTEDTVEPTVEETVTTEDTVEPTADETTTDTPNETKDESDN